MIKSIRGIYSRKLLFDKINKLNIKESGIDNDGDPFIILDDGTIFFGHKLKIKSDKYLYKMLSVSIRNLLQPECVQVAKDIVVRYVEGGLKYGGPKKQSRYQVKKGDHVAEMGAYQGFCSIKLAQQVGIKGKVIAIEPMPDNFRLLKKNREANNLTQMILVNRGVWDESKNLLFNRRIGDGQSSSVEMNYENGEQIKVPAETLDSIFEAKGVTAEDFMIIQLNGAEINGLRGLTSFMPKHLSIAARYDTEGKDAAKAIKKLLEDRGYYVEIEQEDYVFGELITT